MNGDKISYQGKLVFIGIDVHRRSYAVSCVCNGVLVKRWQMSANAEQLVGVLKKHYVGAVLVAAYEAGFSGYALYRYLESRGIKTLVVNPLSIEVSSRDRVKTDKRDSAKIATQMDKEIKEQSQKDPLEPLYSTVSGIGKIAARVLSNELGDMKRFPNERALFSYTGLTPQEYSSGEKRRLGHISRQGNPRLRAILVECAWTALRQDPKLKSDFERISRRGGKKGQLLL